MIHTISKVSRDAKGVCKIRFDPLKVHFILLSDASEDSVRVWADIKQVRATAVPEFGGVVEWRG